MPITLEPMYWLNRSIPGTSNPVQVYKPSFESPSKSMRPSLEALPKTVHPPVLTDQEKLGQFLYHRHTPKVLNTRRVGLEREKSKTENIPWWEPIQVQRDYASLLMRPEWGWDWFGHLTFREAIHPEAADKIFNKWTHNINRKIFGSRYWNNKEKGVLWARGTELQSRDVLHYHFLMSRVPGDLKRLVMMDQWDQLAGFARIHPFKAAGGAESYVVKYAAKGGQIDFGGPLSLLKNRLPNL